MELSPAPDHDGDGKAFTISGIQHPGDVRIDQLAHEIGDAHGWGENVGNWNYYWDSALEGPVLWMSRKDVDLTKMASAARKHKRNDNFVAPGILRAHQNDNAPLTPTPPNRPTTP